MNKYYNFPKISYGVRFGLYYVNYQTMERTPKLSAKFYQEVIKANAAV